MCYPPTPDSQPLVRINEDQNDAGYDDDEAIEPFLDAVCNEPPLHGTDEEEIWVGVNSKVPDISEPVTL